MLAQNAAPDIRYLPTRNGQMRPRQQTMDANDPRDQRNKPRQKSRQI